MFRTATAWVVAALVAGVLAAFVYEPSPDESSPDGFEAAEFDAADLEQLLADRLDPVVVADAVAGFERATVADAGTCQRIRFEMATTMDNLELNEALSLWVESEPGSEVEQADGAGVTLRHC